MRQRYLLDNEKLIFHKEEISGKQKLRGVLNYIGVGVGVALIIWCLFFVGVIKSPEGIVLAKKNNVIITNLVQKNNHLDHIANQLLQIQARDDNFYRVISGIEPLPTAYRQAGFGGTDNYAHLQGYSNSDLLIASTKKSDILIKQLHVQSKSYDTVIYLAQVKQDSLLSAPGIIPIAPGEYHRISDPFGIRIHPITGKRQKHTGIDIAARIGKKIHSTGNGVVVSVGKSNIGYGNRVVIKHGFGFKSLYAHMNEIYVKTGDRIARGQVIGTVGNTGSSTGPHLHYEVIYKNQKCDPEGYYINDLDDSEFKEMVGLFSANNQ